MDKDNDNNNDVDNVDNNDSKNTIAYTGSDVDEDDSIFLKGDDEEESEYDSEDEEEYEAYLDELLEQLDEKDFYLEDLLYINFCYIYVDIDKNIENIKNEKQILSHTNEIKKDELIKILKAKTSRFNKKYSLMYLLKYNISLEPSNFKEFLLTDMDADVNTDTDTTLTANFLQSVVTIDSIPLKKTMPMFQEMNTIYVLFGEKSTTSSTTSTTTTSTTNKKTRRSKNRARMTKKRLSTLNS
jgi:hypothetical protein